MIDKQVLFNVGPSACVDRCDLSCFRVANHTCVSNQWYEEESMSWNV